MELAVSVAQATAEAPRLKVRVYQQHADSANAGFTLEVEFAIPAGITILFGASGAGKTTLLDCIAGLHAPQRGRIEAGSTVLFDSAMGVNLPPERRKLGYLFQSPALFPHMTVEQNVEYGLASLAVAERRSRAADILQSFHVAGLAERRPGEISGGERQRVGLARSLITRPRVLLLDEPLTALDAVTKARIVDDLREWNQRHAVPILYVTHDRQEVFGLGERMLVLEKGRVIAQGLPQEVLQRPHLESVAQLAGFENTFDCQTVSEHPEQGTMTCRIAGSTVELEVPLTRMDRGKGLRVGIRAGDILLASGPPQGLSARNVIAGKIASLEQRDVTVIADVDCGARFVVHVTPGARQSLGLQPGAAVWLVVKTYSCHVLQ